MTENQVIQNYNSLSLAYIGDAVYELLARNYILNCGTLQNGKMHILTKQLVSSKAQSGFLDAVMPHLTETEAGVVRRGRNSKPHSHPKNADIGAYHSATALEALFGFLFLCEKQDRINEIFNIIVNAAQN